MKTLPRAMTHLVEITLGHMKKKQGGQAIGDMLLSGDPGIGKTTFVEMLGSLLGIDTVVIEVPHVVEEHLINIPFLVFNARTNQESHDEARVSDNYRLVLAQSNLYTKLTATQPIPDAQYLQHIKTAPAHIQTLYQELGGTAEKIPPLIQSARQKYHVILFLDEYYRQTSSRIRNVMRQFLNRRLGVHRLPQTVYMITASNMADTGLEDIPSNHQFRQIDFHPPAKEEWFDWLVSSFEHRNHTKMNTQVVEKFRTLLKDEHISYQDVSADVRTSPRRWEQLLLYINSSLPIETEAEGRALLTNVKNNFVNYQSNEYSDLHKKVLKAVSELIRSTSGHKVDATDTLGSHDWRDALQHQIEQKKKLGDQRKYIPVVSGPPGIGKTKEAWKIAEKLDLRMIEVDVSELFPDDVIGLPIPGKQTADDEITVKFSLPKLHHQIMSEIQTADEAYKGRIRREHPEDADKRIAAYEKAPWKYLIFFDEINRVDERTFNSLRKVILEKNFGADEKGAILRLPKEAIVIAAMNPEPEAGGTHQLTSHFKDVIDVIPATASWRDARKFLAAQEFPDEPETTKDAALRIIDALVEKFQTRDHNKWPPEQAPFHLDIGRDIYVSPREYTDMLSTLVEYLHMGVQRILANTKVKESEMRDELDHYIGEALEHSINFPMTKQQAERAEFITTLKQWIANLDDSVLGGLVTKKTKAVSTMEASLSKYLEGEDLAGMPENVHFVNVNSTINNAQFVEQIKTTLFSKIKTAKDVRKYVLAENQPAVQRSDDGKTLTTSGTNVSLLENFIIALLHTLHIHEYQHDRLVALGTALSSAASDLLRKMSQQEELSEDEREDVVAATTTLRSKISKITKGLK